MNRFPLGGLVMWFAILAAGLVWTGPLAITMVNVDPIPHDFHHRRVGRGGGLEQRAERIQEWPFDEATFARVVAIASFVTAGTLARLILAPFGI
jgi:hypothetical protein